MIFTVILLSSEDPAPRKERAFAFVRPTCRQVSGDGGIPSLVLVTAK